MKKSGVGQYLQPTSARMQTSSSKLACSSLKLPMLFDLDPSASKPVAGFSWQLFNLHNPQQNEFSLSLILKGYLQRASEMSFGVNGF